MGQLRSSGTEIAEEIESFTVVSFVCNNAHAVLVHTVGTSLLVCIFLLSTFFVCSLLSCTVLMSVCFFAAPLAHSRDIVLPFHV